MAHSLQGGTLGAITDDMTFDPDGSVMAAVYANSDSGNPRTGEIINITGKAPTVKKASAIPTWLLLVGGAALALGAFKMLGKGKKASRRGRRLRKAKRSKSGRGRRRR